ncbi:unnamed protein product (macronuclear) [Paramecium tetraurelia]|uniref:Protein kinase domain-containing protein n=1 Tax=Paramecium tetraurelia TaxID=5888 RepID=A0EEZ4_PARTE|nr:uncharacterized protein GSPATT00026208001 [Paramecium tetraurelia]CAK93885.1 unnamed protein product [Paramecium tetraurelia]|eukprot:XP_001461258.1 hypothetical protein (macronuclear) [Paramecium tetraurelia strain d4-2]
MDQKKFIEAKQKLKDYRILQTLCQIDFSIYKLAKNKKTGDYILIKIYAKKSLTSNISLRNKVQQEQIFLSTLKSPFIIKTFDTFEDEDNYYILQEYCQGGNLISLLSRFRPDNDLAVFYAAQVVLLLEYLHSKNILFRCINSEIFHICSDGYLKISDFFHAKQMQKKGRTYTIAGFLEYIAPEVICQHGHALSPDWWALGVLIFELLAGILPFYGDFHILFNQIQKGQIKYPDYFSKEAKDLISQLLQVRPFNRLGYIKGGVNDVKKHKWFKNINWKELAQKNIKAPYIPKINGFGDTSNYNYYLQSNEGEDIINQFQQ